MILSMKLIRCYMYLYLEFLVSQEMPLNLLMMLYKLEDSVVLFSPSQCTGPDRML